MNALRVPAAQLRVRVYDVLRDAIERGLAIGWRRAHKHPDKPTEEMMREQILLSVMAEVSEGFEFENAGPRRRARRRARR